MIVARKMLLRKAGRKILENLRRFEGPGVALSLNLSVRFFTLPIDETREKRKKNEGRATVKLRHL